MKHRMLICLIILCLVPLGTCARMFRFVSVVRLDRRLTKLPRGWTTVAVPTGGLGAGGEGCV